MCEWGAGGVLRNRSWLGHPGLKSGSFVIWIYSQTLGLETNRVRCHLSNAHWIWLVAQILKILGQEMVFTMYDYNYMRQLSPIPTWGCCISVENHQLLISTGNLLSIYHTPDTMLSLSMGYSSKETRWGVCPRGFSRADRQRTRWGQGRGMTAVVGSTYMLHAKSLQLWLILCDPMEQSLPCSSVHGILQARILEWAAMPFSRGSSQPKAWTCISREYKGKAM